MMRRSIAGLVMILALSLLVLVPAAAQDEDDSDQLQVIASYSILGDVVQQVAGDAAEVSTIIPLNADPHSYEPNPRQVQALTQADVVFTNGAGFEEGVADIIAARGDEVRTVTASSCVPVRRFGSLITGEGGHDHAHEGESHDHEGDDHAHEGESHDHEGDDHAHEGESHAHEGDEAHGDIAALCESHHEALASLRGGMPEHYDAMSGTLYNQDCGTGHGHNHGGDDDGHAHGPAVGGCDPHMWYDVNNVILWTYRIRDALSEIDPDNAETYNANAEAYVAELADLAVRATASMNTIPEENRVLISSHMSFGYLIAQADFRRMESVIPGGGTLGEPSASAFADLNSVIEETGVPAIFAENTISSDLIDQLADQTGVEVRTLFTGSLSEADGPAPSYVDYMDYNVSTIVEALGGQMVDSVPDDADASGDEASSSDDTMADTSAAYMGILNQGDSDDALVSVSTDFAASVELHQTTVDEDDVARMTPVDSISVSAGETASLRPGGYHVMLIDVDDLQPGDTITLTLTFESGETVSVDVPVVEGMADAPQERINADGFVILNPWVRATAMG